MSASSTIPLRPAQRHSSALRFVPRSSSPDPARAPITPPTEIAYSVSQRTCAIGVGVALGIMDTLELDRQLKGMGAMSIKQVAVRRWKNGRVVHERFYHK